MIVIRECRGFDEMQACVELQVETWGYDPTDLIPKKTFLLAQKIGGQVMGAFDQEQGTREQGNQGTGEQGTGNREQGAEDRDQGSGIRDQEPDPGGSQKMIGFVMALPGIKNHPDGARPYLHSHMLAVRQAYRNKGIGLRLKLEQRIDALARGIRHMEWTFDPLEIKNAYLNIHRLGAVVCEYRPDFYGVSSSRLQGGLPTDRLVAEWELDSNRVKSVLDGHPPAALRVEERISVPAAIYQWKASDIDRDRALAVQLENRDRFQRAFQKGLAVLGYSVDAEGNGVFELGRVDDGH
jgi:predicted GNAT superfamily acetyltransferase